MNFNISPQDVLPIYRQIVEQVQRAIASGQAKPGDELPSVRALAQTHAINPMTVSKAYSLLEAEGLLERRRGMGMVIAAQPTKAGQRQRLDLLEPALSAAASQAAQLGLKHKDALRLFEKCLQAQHPAGADSGEREMTDFAIQAEHLNLRLQSGLLTQKQVLQDISFQLPEGAVMGLVGRNGAGKTSLLQCLLGLSLPSTGQSSLLGCSSAALDDATRERLGYVAQTPDLFGWLTGGAHLRELTGIYKHFDERRALELALRLGVPLGMRADKLSLGDQQKLSVVLALGHDPDLLIMDEPVASLDPLARREFMRALFAERRSERPRSILLSSHLLADLERVVTHVMFLREGRVQLVDEWDALVENLRLVKLAEIPASAAVVHSRMVMGTWHVLVDLRRCASSERAAWSQGQVLLMDDLFEELNT